MTSEEAGSRRNFLKFAGAGTAATGILIAHFAGETNGADAGKPGRVFDVRRFGAKGDGVTLDTAAINNAIAAAAGAGGGPYFFLQVPTPATRFI